MLFILIIFGLSMLYTATTSRLEVYVKTLALQGLLLFFLVLGDYDKVDWISLIFLTFETAVVKAWLIPRFLQSVLRKNALYREVAPSIPQFYASVIANIFFIFGFVIAYILMKHSQGLEPLTFGISVSTILTSFFIMLTRKKIITHVMGFMLMENGIFLLSLSVAKELPLVVNMGVLLDIFAGLFLLGMLVSEVQDQFQEIHIDSLTDLKD